MPTPEVDDFDFEDDDFDDEEELGTEELLALAAPEEVSKPAPKETNKPAPKPVVAKAKVTKRKDLESEAVVRIERLLLEGDQDAIVTALHPFCTHNNGIKAAKQLLRDARDRAKSRVTRISGIVNIILDEFKDPDEES